MYYSAIEIASINNGEVIRCVLWESGCTHHCKNCQNKQTWDKNYGKEFTGKQLGFILNYLSNDLVDGITFWNVYGYERNEEKSHVITDFIKMANEYKVIHMRTDGEEVRQFLYGDDCAECLIELSKQYDSIDRSKQLHITNFEWDSIYNIAEMIQELTDCKIIKGENKDTVQLDKRNEPDPYILNFWKPKTTLKNGIKNVFNLIK